MQHYVKKLGKKNYWRKSRSVRIIVSIIVSVIFFGALGWSGNRGLKRHSTAKPKVRSRYCERELGNEESK